VTPSEGRWQNSWREKQRLWPCLFFEDLLSGKKKKFAPKKFAPKKIKNRAKKKKKFAPKKICA
jgi:hypothetical protein